MTIRFLTAWNGYRADQIVNGLGGTEENRLVGLGFASFDVDGANDGVESIVKAKTNPLTGGDDFSGGVSTLRLPPGVTDVTSGFGGVGIFVTPGNGVDSDHAAIEAARDAAGVNGYIVFKAGATYVLDRSVRFLDGQTIYGFGATVIRTPQAVSTTITSITSDVTKVVTVAEGDGPKFKVGQRLNIYSAGVGGALAVQISSIVGDVITCSSAFRIPGGGTWAGATIATANNQFELVDNCKLIGITIDGNSATVPYASWQVCVEVLMIGANITIDHCNIKNAPGEGVMESGVAPFKDTRNKIINNSITDIKGNGVHLSASYGCRVTGNYIYNCNSNGEEIGHNGGCITLSNYVAHALISNNHLELGRAGVGQVDSNDNSFVTITNNTIANMSTYMLECRGNTISLNNIKIIGNRFFNDAATVGAALISVAIEDVSSTSFVSEVVVASNTFVNAGLVLRRTNGCTIIGNSFKVSYETNDTFHNPIYLTNGFNCVVSGNTTQCGYAGMQLNGDQKQVLVSGNSFYFGNQFGIAVTGGAGNSNVTYSNNIVLNDTNANVNYQGIVVGANTVVRGNTVKIVAGHSGIRVYGGPNCVVSGNVVRAHAAGKTIRVETGSTGYVVAENQVSHAVYDAPAAGVRVSNNDIIM